MKWLILALVLVACTPMQKAEVTTITEINNIRQDAALNTLTVDQRLETVAHERATYLATTNALSHNAPCNVFCLMSQEGLPGEFEGENIGWNDYDWNSSAQEIVTAWRNSPDHLANITNCHYELVGSGVAVDASGHKWYSMVFWGARSC